MIKQIAILATLGLILTIGALSTIYPQHAVMGDTNHNTRNDNGFYGGGAPPYGEGGAQNPPQNGQNP